MMQKIKQTQQAMNNLEGLNIMPPQNGLAFTKRESKQGARVERTARTSDDPTYFLTLLSVLPAA